MPDNNEVIEEPEDAGEDHHVPVELVELNEVLAWKEALEAQGVQE